MRMAADELVADGGDDVGEGENPLLLRHARMEDHLKQQIAEFVPQFVEIAALDGVGHLIGLLDRIGRDGAEILFEIPGTAGSAACAARP